MAGERSTKHQSNTLVPPTSHLLPPNSHRVLDWSTLPLPLTSGGRMREAVVVDMVRTPFGRAGQRGAFRDITHVELATALLKEVLERNKLPAAEVDEILWGSVGIAGMLTRSRHYLFEAGLPFTVSATDMNKQCGSSLQAVAQGAFAIMCDMSDVVLAGGVETMDRVQPIARTTS